MLLVVLSRPNSTYYLVTIDIASAFQEARRVGDSPLRHGVVRDVISLRV